LLSGHALGAGGDPLLLEDASGMADSTGSVPVAAPVGGGSATGAGPTWLATLARRPVSLGSAERTVTVRVCAPLAGTGLAPVWTHEPAATSGNALLACDATGAVLVVAFHDPDTGEVQVDRLALESGALLASARFAAGALRALDVADGGAPVALVAGAFAWVLDASGQLVHVEPLASTTEALALSRDGSALALGDFSGVRVLDTATWTPSVALPRPTPSELPVRVALSADGDTLAVAWWTFTTGASVRVRVHEGGAVRNELVQSGAGGGLQNYPQALAIGADGRRIACGLWGYQDERPELVLLERGVPEPLLAVDLGGSALALALDPSGTRVAVARKHAHANQFGTTGAVELFDTGERDLQVLGAPEPGGELRLAHRMDGAAYAWFVLGRPSRVAIPLPGIAGALLLDPSFSSFAIGAQADASGRADLALPLPSDPTLLGARPALQALSFGTDGLALSSWLARPLLF
jgi:hypothetical protein